MSSRGNLVILTVTLLAFGVVAWWLYLPLLAGPLVVGFLGRLVRDEVVDRVRLG